MSTYTYAYYIYIYIYICKNKFVGGSGGPENIPIPSPPQKGLLARVWATFPP